MEENNEELKGYEELLSERIGSDIYMKTSRNGKEIRKAYETVGWKSEKEINSFPEYEGLTIIANGIENGDTEGANQTLSMVPGQEVAFTTNPDYINLGYYTSNIRVAHVSVYNNNTLKKIEATNPGTATITVYDSDDPTKTVSIDVTVNGGETETEEEQPEEPQDPQNP